jgi:MFS family permease
MARSRWLTRELWLISLSAFFADLGYQAVLAGFPLFLVLDLHRSPLLLGLATALAYGPGALMGYLGGRLGDRLGHKRVAVFGNSLIPFLSLSGLFAAPGAIATFALGWWARNFRSPSRRVMLTEVVPAEHQPRAFGFLHALDVGGGFLAAMGLAGLLALNVTLPRAFLLTLIPLVLSTLTLLGVPAGLKPTPPRAQAGGRSPQLGLYRGILIATALYGFSTYSLSFPILTVAQSGHSFAQGALAYAVFLGVSALAGLWIGARKGERVRQLAYLGYLGAGVGSFALALAYLFLAPVWVEDLAIALLGFALGVVETLEPSLIARLTPQAQGGGMGALTAMRSLGLFVGNLLMGLLYRLTPTDAYTYAAAVAVAAALILLSQRPSKALQGT